MADIGSILSGTAAIGNTILGGIQTGFNYSEGVKSRHDQEWLNRWQMAQYLENRDYQRALQERMFEREDTGVQRRMADMKAAGINPNLAAGNAAPSGSAVSQPSAPSLGAPNPAMIQFGKIFDVAKAVADTRSASEQAEYWKQAAKEKKWQADQAEKKDMMMALDLDRDTWEFDYERGEWSGKDDVPWINERRLKTMIMNRVYNQMLVDYDSALTDWSNARKRGELYDKEIGWYDINQGLHTAGSLIDDFKGLWSTFGPKKKSYSLGSLLFAGKTLPSVLKILGL